MGSVSSKNVYAHVDKHKNDTYGFVDVLLTVHLSIILATDQLGAQIIVL